MKAVKNQIFRGRFSSWAIGRAEAYKLVAMHYPMDSKFWRELMRENARKAVLDAKFHLSMGINQ